MKKFLHIFFIAAIAATALALTGVDACKNQPTQNDTTHVPPAGPDTTSNNWTWTYYTGFGGEELSYWSDAIIFSDTDIWVGGYINVVDTTRLMGVRRYNFARWNGKTWTMDSIPFNEGGSPPSIDDAPIHSFYEASPTDIWAFTGFLNGGVDRWQNGRWQITSYGGVDGGGEWGTSPTDFYSVSGGISHWNGQSFQEIPVQTGGVPVDIIYGGMNPVTNAQEIYAIASWDSGGKIPQSTMLRVQGTTATRFSGGRNFNLLTNFAQATVDGFWFKPNQTYILSIAGRLYTTGAPVQDTTYWWLYPVQLPYAWATTDNFGLSGQATTDTNDIWMVGFKHLCHYNGARWAEYPLASGFAGALHVKGDIAIKVGQDPSNYFYGYIAIGRRTN